MTLSIPRRLLAAAAAVLLLAGSALAAQPAPDLVLETDEGPLALQDLAGQVVYVDFWASWCAPCRESFPWMNAMQARYGGKGLRIVAVNVDSDPELRRRFVERYPARFTIAYDPSGKAAERFHVKGMPSAYVIDRDGNVKAAHVGFREKDTAALEAMIASALAE